MYNTNALKLGIFGANCSSGRSATKLPERWSASWPDCLRLARMADEAGIDFMLPIGRWKGYGGDTDFHGSTLETVTWAVGLLSATQRMTVFDLPMSFVYGVVCLGCFMMLVRQIQVVWGNARDGWRRSHEVTEQIHPD